MSDESSTDEPDPVSEFRQRVEKAVARAERDKLTRHEIGRVLENIVEREYNYEFTTPDDKE
jgi:hypothetical protein